MYTPTASYRLKLAHWPGSHVTSLNVRFGSLADICSAKGHVRFAPNSDHESGHAEMVMSALPPKADVCSALAHVCFWPIADMCSDKTADDLRRGGTKNQIFVCK